MLVLLGNKILWKPFQRWKRQAFRHGEDSGLTTGNPPNSTVAVLNGVATTVRRVGKLQPTPPPSGRRTGFHPVGR